MKENTALNQASQNRSAIFLSALLALILCAPVFFTLQFGIFRGDSFGGEFALPISILFFPVLFLYLAVKLGVKTPASYFYTIVTIFFLFCFALSAGGLDADFSLFFLYFYPAIVAFYVGLVILKINFSIYYFKYYFSNFSVLFALLFLAASFFEYGIIAAFSNRGADSIFGIFSVYQKFIYYPTMLAVAFALALDTMAGPKCFFSVLILILSIVMTGSREASLLALLFSIIFLFRFLPKSVALVSSFVFLVFVFSLIQLLRESLEDITFFLKIYSMVDSREFSGGRFDAMEYVYSSVQADWFFYFFGNMFQIVGQEIGTPHNQYLEWHLRGGIIFVLFSILVVIYAICISRRFAHQSAFIIVMVGLMLVSNNINTPFRAPYTSMFIWFVLGLMISSRNLIKE